MVDFKSGSLSSSQSSSSGLGSSTTVDSKVGDKPKTKRSVGSSKLSDRSESIDSLASLANLVEKHTKPHYSDYNEFATSYISSTIPSQDRLLYDDTGSYTAEPPPFKTAVKVREFELQEKRRKEIGPSKRQGKIIPSSKAILKEIKNSRENIKESDGRRSYLFHKARQWCEVTKALAADAKYPKASVAVIRDKYSAEHKKATELARKAQGLRDNARLFQAKTQVSPFPIPLELIGGELDKDSPGLQAMAKIVQEEEAGQAEVREALANLMADIEPIPELQTKLEEPWQFKALKTSLPKLKPKKKAPFKRTEYPPKSRDEKIADLRKLLPPPKGEDLETDYLSGIWERELMSESFSISGLNYDSRIVDDKSKGSAQVEWTIVHDAKQKCKNWLLAIPD